ncbi:hypothetical protein V1478_011108 [Vespula squamosa]|uniref:Uncharacterized protein n=1 Tax=Vespula squamosa TaxID=30214 RepID=A0ABD2AGY2_VESSQ
MGLVVDSRSNVHNTWNNEKPEDRWIYAKVSRVKFARIVGSRKEDTFGKGEAESGVAIAAAVAAATTPAVAAVAAAVPGHQGTGFRRRLRRERDVFPVRRLVPAGEEEEGQAAVYGPGQRDQDRPREKEEVVRGGGGGGEERRGGGGGGRGFLVVVVVVVVVLRNQEPITNHPARSRVFVRAR